MRSPDYDKILHHCLTACDIYEWIIIIPSMYIVRSTLSQTLVIFGAYISINKAKKQQHKNVVFT